MHRSVSTRWLGYDAEALAALPAVHRRHLTWLSDAWLLSALLLSAPVGYAAFLVEGSLWLTLLSSAGCFALVVNLLRLLTASGGAAPAASEAQILAWVPARGGSVAFFVLATILSQPAQLPLHQQVLEAPVEAHRRGLIAQHQASLGSSAAGASGDPYAAQLQRCEFVVLRLQRMWDRPLVAFGWSVFFVALVLVPAFLGRFVLLGALRAYHHTRWRVARPLVQREAERTALQVRASLARFAPPLARARRDPFAQRPSPSLFPLPAASDGVDAPEGQP